MSMNIDDQTLYLETIDRFGRTIRYKIKKIKNLGENYTLTEEEKQDITTRVMEALPFWQGGKY